VLQITDFTENPRGVKLRYKLAQSLSATSGPLVEPATIQFRWVAEPGQINAATELLADTRESNSRKTLAVLRDVLMDGSDVESSGFSKYSGSDGRELIIFFKPNSRYKLFGATKLNQRRQLALVWKNQVAGSVEIDQGIYNGLKIVLGTRVSEQEGVALQKALGADQ
jgi:preprotein translocase subunit SecD